MDKEKFPFGILSELKMIHFDFENKIFEINGIDIGHLTDVDISFHNREWSLTLTQKGIFTINGKHEKNVAAQ